MDDLRGVEVRGEGKGARRGRDPGIEATNEEHAPGGWRRGNKEQAVVAAGPYAGSGARGEPTETVRLEPFGLH